MFKQITVVKNKVVKRTLAASGNSALPAWARQQRRSCGTLHSYSIFFFRCTPPFRVSGGT